MLFRELRDLLFIAALITALLILALWRLDEMLKACMKTGHPSGYCLEVLR